MDTNKELFQKIDTHLLQDVKPSEYLEKLDDSSLAEFPFSMLERLKSTQQSPQHHPEGNVWNHTMLVVDEAAIRKSQSSSERVFQWAALLHDIGKPETTRVRKGKITAYGHEKLGAQLAEKFLNTFEESQDFINHVCALIRWHMQVLHVVKSLPYADIKSMKEQVSPRDVALLGMCDRLGRLGADKKDVEKSIAEFLEKCREE